MTVSHKSAIDAIEGLDSLIGQLNTVANALNEESHTVATDWHAFVMAGGRGDHKQALALLNRLRPHLVKLAGICTKADRNLGRLNQEDAT